MELQINQLWIWKVHSAISSANECEPDDPDEPSYQNDTKKPIFLPANKNKNNAKAALAPSKS